MSEPIRLINIDPDSAHKFNFTMRGSKLTVNEGATGSEFPVTSVDIEPAEGCEFRFVDNGNGKLLIDSVVSDSPEPPDPPEPEDDIIPEDAELIASSRDASWNYSDKALKDRPDLTYATEMGGRWAWHYNLTAAPECHKPRPRNERSGQTIKRDGSTFYAAMSFYFEKAPWFNNKFQSATINQNHDPRSGWNGPGLTFLLDRRGFFPRVRVDPPGRGRARDLLTGIQPKVGEWMDFIMVYQYSEKPNTTGWIELYYNGEIVPLLYEGEPVLRYEDGVGYTEKNEDGILPDGFFLKEGVYSPQANRDELNKKGGWAIYSGGTRLYKA